MYTDIHNFSLSNLFLIFENYFHSHAFFKIFLKIFDLVALHSLEYVTNFNMVLGKIE